MTMNAAGEVKQCAVHDGTFDGECQFCLDEMEALQGGYNALVQRNHHKAKLMHQQGVGLNDGQVLAQRLDMIIDLVFRENPKARAHFEIAFVEAVHEGLLEIEKEANRMRLVNGVNGFNPHKLPHV